MVSKYWEKGKYNIVETVITNMVSGIYRTPFDRVLLVDSIRDDVLKILGEGYDNSDTLVQVQDFITGEVFTVNEGCLSCIERSFGDLDKVFYRSLFTKNILDGKLHVIDKDFRSDEGLLVYCIDLSHSETFITPLFVIKDEMNETLSFGGDMFDDFVFNSAITGYCNNPYLKSTFLGKILSGNLKTEFPIDMIVKGNPEKTQSDCTYKDITDDYKLSYLKSLNYGVFKVIDGKYKGLLFSLPAYEAFNICVFDRKFYHENG